MVIGDGDLIPTQGAVLLPLREDISDVCRQDIFNFTNSTGVMRMIMLSERPGDGCHHGRSSVLIIHRASPLPSQLRDIRGALLSVKGMMYL